MMMTLPYIMAQKNHGPPKISRYCQSSAGYTQSPLIGCLCACPSLLLTSCANIGQITHPCLHLFFYKKNRNSTVSLYVLRLKQVNTCEVRRPPSGM